MRDVDLLKETTRTKLDRVSRALLQLHKALLEDERAAYEAVHGRVASSNEMFQLVLNHAQFAWLRKISSLIALLDDAASVRRPATETSAQALLVEAHSLLQLDNGDEVFAERLQIVVQRGATAKAYYEEALKVATIDE